MNKVYIVTDGEYSDYRILAVFSTREVAEDFRIKTCSGCGRTDEWELDVITHIPPGRAPWEVWITKDGYTSLPVRLYGLRVPNANWGEPRFDKLNREAGFHVFACDKEHAKKIVREKWAQIIAENRWGKDE